MKNTFYLLLSIMTLIVLLNGCKKEETKAEMLVGKWVITSSTLLGTQFTADGSYLKFNECGDNCTGVDYNGTNQTSGTFTWVINDEGTSLTIDDNSADGGNFDATFSVTELTSTSLKMNYSTHFGSYSYNLSKE